MMSSSRLVRTVSLAGTMALALAATPLLAQATIATGAPMAQQTGPSAGASADYQVGAGDLLSISVYRSPDLQETVRVGTDGTISFPSLGKVAVADLTAGDIAAKLAAGLKAKGILVEPSVNVLVSEVRSKVVMVMGSVQRPGEVPLDRPNLTLAAVLARAGAAFGTGSGVVTVMEGKQENAPREQVLIADLVSGAKDRNARSGEILVVQSAPTIYVSGEVGRPGSFPLEPNMTVGQAIALGGGITPRGSSGRVRVTRKMPNGTSEELKGVNFNTRLQPDDLVYVRQRLF
jgi:polysaccharide biosynthesis/export protein